MVNRGSLFIRKSPASIGNFIQICRTFFVDSPGLRKFFQQNFLNLKKVMFQNNFQARSAKRKGGSGGNSAMAPAGVGRRPTTPHQRRPQPERPLKPAVSRRRNPPGKIRQDFHSCKGMVLFPQEIKRKGRNVVQSGAVNNFLPAPDTR